MQLLQEERRKREELEKKLNNEINLREKIIEENIKLRDKKQAQVIINTPPLSIPLNYYFLLRLVH